MANLYELASEAIDCLEQYLKCLNYDEDGRDSLERAYEILGDMLKKDKAEE